MTLYLQIPFETEGDLTEAPSIDSVSILFSQGRSITVYPEETDCSLEEGVGHYRLKGLVFYNPEEAYLDSLFADDNEDIEFNIVNITFDEGEELVDFSIEEVAFSYCIHGKFYPEEEIDEKAEIELNRAWIYDEEGIEIGETNFTVPLSFVQEMYRSEYRDIFPDFEEFLNCYEPEVEGEHIYQEAKRRGNILEDIGRYLYGDLED